MFLAQTTTQSTSPYSSLFIVVGIIGLVMLFMPLWIASVRHRSTLVLWAVIFTLLSAAVGATAMFSMAGGFGLAGLVGLYAATGVANVLWLIALLLGLAAAVDGMAESRMKREKRLAAENNQPPQARRPMPMAPRP